MTRTRFRTVPLPLSGQRPVKIGVVQIMIMKIGIIFGVLVLLYLSVDVIWIRDRTDRFTRVRCDLTAFRYACLAYRREYGSFPTGSQERIVAALSGKNDRKILFLEVPEHEGSATNLWLDPWGSPYQVMFLSPSNVVTRSAGRDKMWGTADDIERK